jgi:hypothetical protein
VIVDELLETRERKDHAHIRELTRRIEREQSRERKEIGDRRNAIRDSTKKRQQDEMELENRSGQLKAQSQVSTRQSTLKAKRREPVEMIPQEIEAMKDLEKLDERLSNLAQESRKSQAALFFDNVG